METTLNRSSQVYNSDLGEFISEAHAHLAQVLHDYKPTLSLIYIPKKDRDETDTKPWAILDSPANLAPHIIRYMSDAEMQKPAEILAWIFEGDLDKHRPDDDRDADPGVGHLVGVLRHAGESHAEHP